METRNRRQERRIRYATWISRFVDEEEEYNKIEDRVE